MKDLKGKDVEAGIEQSAGGTSLTGAGIDFYRLLMIRSGLRMLAVGMKMSRHLPAATTLARRELGIKGNLASLTRQVEEIINRVQKERGEASDE